MHDSSFEIREAGENDMDALFGLFEQVQSLHAEAEPDFFRRPERDDFFESFFAGVKNDPEQYLVVACTNGNPVGFCQYFLGTRSRNLYRPDRRLAYINGLVVSEDHRRRGCATALIGYVKAQARDRDITRLGLDFWTFNDAARNCFANAGFNVKQEHMWLKI